MKHEGRRLLWIPLFAVLLVPVVRHIAGHGHPGVVPGGGGVLLAGLGSLDSLLEEALGRPVLINFWATWCSPCVRELPLLELAADSAGQGATVVAVSIGDRSIDDVRRFMEARQPGLAVVWLDAADAAAAVEAYGLPDAVPVTIVLDGHGSEVARAVGAREYSWFAGQLSEVAGGMATGTAGSAGDEGIHVNVVGSRTDSLALALETEAVRLAGEGAVDFYDPSVPAESAAAAALFLPLEGLPYAQPCLGGACGRPVRSPADLAGAIDRLAAP